MRQDAKDSASTAGTPIGDQLAWLAERCTGEQRLRLQLVYRDESWAVSVVGLRSQPLFLCHDSDLGVALQQVRAGLERRDAADAEGASDD